MKIENVINDGFFGFRLPLLLMRASNEGRLIEFSVKRFESAPHPQNKTLVNRALSVPVILTKDPVNIKAMLSTQFDDFSLGLRLHQFAPLLGKGIFTLDGPEWKQSRSMLRPQFAKDRVSHILDLEPHFVLLRKHIDGHNGDYFDIQELYFRFSMDVATGFLFGESVGSLKDEDARFLEAFNESQKYLATRATLHELYFLCDGFRFRQYNKVVRKFCSQCVHKALDVAPEDTSEYVFLRELVKHTRDPVVLQDQALNVLLAGRDTTASLLSFATFELARNDHMWRKLREEVILTMGPSSDEITVAGLKSCRYLKAILNETLRLYPSVPRNARFATRNTTLPRGGGPDGSFPILIRKGQPVGYFICATHLNEKVYGNDSHVFRPERWAALEGKSLGWSYLPFNGGPRSCLGQQFAILEASYVLARLTQCYTTIQLRTTEYPPKKLVHLTMSLLNGVYIRTRT
ncbi:hypothetical protein Cantr_10238 [Candida viswanathii]|uniref:Cytochrome P450 n=1 Tax=Candida viswanathii TaxID=5486 RepID=A0A367YD30_9ASCO|nr:hypothetical protein Cantr_10238 [Candida viswanathii]